MAGIPLWFGTAQVTDNRCGSRISGFFKLASLPGATTAIMDIDGAGTAYLRLSYVPTVGIRAEASVFGAAGSVNVCFGGFTVSAGVWYWISASVFASGIGSYNLYGQIWGPGGLTPGVASVTPGGAPSTLAQPSCRVGWGVALSSGYANFPNTAGNALAEFTIDTAPGGGSLPGGNGPLGPPSGAQGVVGGRAALYHANDTVGTAATIHDATSNHYDLSPGPQGNAVVVDSPF